MIGLEMRPPNDASRGRARQLQGRAAVTAMGTAAAEQTGENAFSSRLA